MDLREDDEPEINSKTVGVKAGPGRPKKYKAGPGRPKKHLISYHIYTTLEAIEGLRNLAKIFDISQGEALHLIWTEYSESHKKKLQRRK